MVGAFVRGKAYGGKSGWNHLAHNLREKTRKDLRGEIEIYGMDKKEFKKWLREVKAYRGHHKYDYYEFTAYIYKPEDVKAAISYFEQQYHRPVLATVHFDESKPHVHIMIAWRDEKGYALGMRNNQFIPAKHYLAKLAGREITPKGQGRSMIPTRTFVANPDYYKAQAEQEKQEIERVKSQLRRILRLYGMIEFYYLKRGKSRRFGGYIFVHNGVLTWAYVHYDEKGKKTVVYKPLSIRTMLYVNNAQMKEIVFAPSHYGFPVEDVKHVPYKVGFLDDIPIDKLDETLKKLPKGSVVVETSHNNFQIHFPLPCKNISVLDLHPYIASFYQGDTHSRDYFHLRKLPGFLNMKPIYVERGDIPQVRIVNKSGGMTLLQWRDKVEDMSKVVLDDLSKDSVKQYIEELRVKIAKKLATEGEKKQLEYLSKVFQPREKQWRDFCKYPGCVGDNFSDVDMRYMVWLYAHGAGEDEIYYHIVVESPNVFVRHPKFQDYFSRTLSKVIPYVENAISEEVKMAMEGKVEKAHDELNLDDEVHL